MTLFAGGMDVFYVGNQGGFDRMLYGCLKQLRNVYPHVRVSVVLAYLPAKKGDAGDSDDTMYPEIEGYPRFAIARRNRWMIERSEHCVCYIRHTWGGAYTYARLAKRKGLDVINLGDSSIEL